MDPATEAKGSETESMDTLDIFGHPTLRANCLPAVYRNGVIVRKIVPKEEATMLDPAGPLPNLRPALPQAQTDANLHRLALDLEAALLFEMLGHAGLGQTQSDFDGGIGETQFASFLRREQANAMAQSGGIGLAETLFRALTGGKDDQDRG